MNFHGLWQTETVSSKYPRCTGSQIVAARVPATLPLFLPYTGRKDPFVKQPERGKQNSLTPQKQSRLRVGASSLPLLHHAPEVAEEVVRIVRTGGCFGVVLHAEQRQRPVAQAF